MSKRTWIDLAMAAGAKDAVEAEGLLWSGSAFPFVGPRHVYEQIRHVVRHKVCFDNPEATCQSKRIERRSP